MKKKIVALLTAIVVLSAGGYAGYQYSIHLAAKSISNMLAGENFSNLIPSDSVLPPSAPDRTITEEPSSGGQKETGHAAASVQSPPPNHDSKNEPAPPASSPPAAQTPNARSAVNKPLSFKSKEEAIQFAISRFSASEIKQIQSMVSGGITPEIKKELKRIAYSKFTREEIEAVRRAVQ
ncbi:hypothetical protein [Paenibacillus sp. EPM92]|uniref:hypothetical protein n=1 Tax=Paenibacillus sp. EPM92 TaxID=1561195 RepID=UPI001916495C|nr:hypothetical protein [Paenibacillus sp. EPM92]